MRSLFLLHIITICLCWMSCGHAPTERLLAEAEARLEHQPDSALAMLQRLPSSRDTILALSSEISTLISSLVIIGVNVNLIIIFRERRRVHPEHGCSMVRTSDSTASGRYVSCLAQMQLLWKGKAR